MAPLPAGQPDLRVEGDGAGPRPSRRRALGRPLLTVFLVWLTATVAASFARASGVNAGVAPVEEMLRVVGACVALFGICGVALTRLLLPDDLRRHELLWILPVGACACALAFTILGFAAVPFDASLVVVPVMGAAAAAWALRREGPPTLPVLREARTIAWPLWLAALVAAFALIPVLRHGEATVIGTGSDAHLAVGSAAFLQEQYPTGTAPEEGVDMMPLVWRSKQAIYYAYGAVARLSGLEPHEVLAPLAAVLLGVACLGFYVMCRDVLGAGVAGASVALALVGLNQMALHTVMHPYFNQTWGFFALPFAIVLSWLAVTRRTRGGLVLLALFLAIGAFAYPLALPIPLVVLGGMAWDRRRELRARLSPRRLYRGRRSLLWMVPLGLFLLVPLGGVLEKMITAAFVVAPGSTLTNWGGDLDGWFPVHQFLSMGSTTALLAAAPFALLAIAGELRRHDRRLAVGLAAVLAFGAFCAVYFRLRDSGWYFHFKALAFVGPIAVAIVAVGVSRWREPGRQRWLRVAATAGLLLLVTTAYTGATREVRETFAQLYPPTIDLRAMTADLAPDASIRLDVDVNQQLWAGIFLADHRLCSQRPLFDTSYPHVPVSRRADYLLVESGLRKPVDAGALVRRNSQFLLYRMRPGVPGRDRCSQRMVQTVERIT